MFTTKFSNAINKGVYNPNLGGNGMYKDISIVRGDTLAFNFEAEIKQNEEYTPVTALTSAYFTVRQEINGVIALQKSLNNGISKVKNGVFAVRVAPADTYNLNVGSYYYDLEITVGSDTYTILNGMFELAQDITREA